MCLLIKTHRYKYCSNFSLLLLVLTVAAFIQSAVTTQLIVNVRSQTGEVFQETISANHSDDWVSLEFMQPDATHVTHLIDFKQELQVVHVVRLGEEELGQKPYHEMCFVTSFSKDDYISSDAMSKLRQKNPWTVRSPEEDLGTVEVGADLSLDVAAAGSLLSSHIPPLCPPASTFAASRDLRAWLNDRQDADSDWAALSDASHQQPSRGVMTCNTLPYTTGSSTQQYNNQPCICQQEVCLWWYPCGLKFCKDRDDAGKSVSYRCGIRTCKKCHVYAFYAASRTLCIQ